MNSGVRKRVRAAFDLAAGARVQIVVVAAVTIGTVLRFHELEAESLWLDELFTADRSDPEHGFDRMVDKLPTDVHPPLYTIFMYYWSLLFGQSDYTLRLPSVIFGVITLLFVAVYYRKLMNDASYSVIIVLFAISPGAIYFAQEARSYSLLLLLSTILTGLAVSMVQQIKSSQTISWRILTPFLVIGLAASYNHYFGFIITTASFAIIILYSFLRFGHLRVSFAYSSIFVLFFPWVAYNYAHISPTTSWIVFRPIRDIEGMLDLAFGKDWLLYLLLIVLTIHLANSYKNRMLSTIIFVPAIIMTLSIFIAVAISLHTPILTSRNLIILLPSLYLMAAHSLADLATVRHPRWQTAFSGLAMLTLTVVMAVGNYKSFIRTEKPQYRESAEFVTSLPECSAANILVGGPFMPAFEYYTNRASDAVKINFILAHPIRAATPVDLQTVLADDCPIVLWLAHRLQVDPELLDMLSEMGAKELVERKFHGAAVFLEP